MPGIGGGASQSLPGPFRLRNLDFTFHSQVHVWSLHEQKHHMSGRGEDIWRRNSHRVRTEIGVPRESSPWSDRPSVHLRGVTPCARQFDLVNLAFEARSRDAKGAACFDDIVDNLWVDLSQTVLRRPWASHVRSFRCRGHLYSFKADRCLDGADSMRLLGWPASFVRGVNAGDLLYLAEDAGSLPLSTLVHLVMWCNPWGPWRDGHP